MSDSDQTVEESTSVPIILLDNNMIQHFLRKTTTEQFGPILEEIEKIGATLATSQIVVYEALKAIIFNDEKYTAVAKFFEDSLTRYPVNEEVLVEAARVHELYGSDEHCKKHRDSFSTEDIILATTSMLLGAYIITSDPNDFPMPFFKENNRQHIDYVEKGRRKHIGIYLLEPDTDAINAALEILRPPKAKTSKKN